MTTDRRDQTTIVGFWLTYAGAMGALLLWTVPIFEPIYRQAIVFGALPCVVVGIALLVYSHSRSG